MTANAEANMSGLKRLWTRIVGIFEALEGMDDPTGDYMLSLGKRVDKLERDLEHLEGQLHSGRDVSGIKPEAIAQTRFHAH
jgi:hypothetical protein